MNPLIPIIRLLVYSHIWIALSAVCYTYAHMWLLQSTKDQNYLVFVGCATMALYGFHRWISFIYITPSDLSLRARLYAPYARPLLAISILSCLASLVAFAGLKPGKQLGILAAIPFGMFYILPILKKNKRLRDYGSLKVFIIALIWTWLCAVLPTEKHTFRSISCWVLSMFFLLGITLPFDVRDLKMDARQGVRTLPYYFGFQRTKFISFALLAIFTLGHSWMAWKYMHHLPVVLSGLSSLCILGFLRPERPLLYYDFLLESCLIHPVFWIVLTDLLIKFS